MELSPGTVLLVLVPGVILLWGVTTANRFVRLRQHLRESWADIQVELKRRYDLIPNLVATVKGYASHEREVLTRVVELRNRAAASAGNAASQSKDETELMLGMKQLFALAEGYPELKADQHFLEPQKQLALTEDRIAAARRFFNSNVRTLNILRESVPTNLIARVMSVEEETFFELEDEAEAVVPRIGL